MEAWRRFFKTPWLHGLLLACLAFDRPTAAPDQRTRFIPKSVPTPPPAPFATPEVMAERKREAEARPLFASEEPLAFTLAGDFKAIDKDRDPESTVTFPGTITFAAADGSIATKPVRIRGRGHTRRDIKLCDFMPLRIEFTKAEMAGTVFGGHNAIKLGTHCRSVAVFEQYVLREYTAYKIFNLITPNSFRARLANATYVDAPTGKTIGRRFAMFLEDEDDVARRMEGRINEQRKFGFSRLDTDSLTLVTLFEYMIGNTDVAFTAQHNVRVVETPAGARYPVPYDFDYSGLVNASYAVVDKTRIRGIDTVRDRRYLGPCRNAEALEPLLARIRAARADIEKLYQLAGLTEASRRDAKSYLDGFYRTLDRPADVKRALIDICESDG